MDRKGIHPGSDSASDILIADRIERELRKEIARSDYEPGAMLPKQDTLVRRYRASRGSVRRALNRLKRDNLIRSVRGKGTFVLKHPAKLRDVVLVSPTPYHCYQVVLAAVISNLLRQSDHSANLVIANDPAEEWPSIIRNRPSLYGVILIGSYPREMIVRLIKKATLPVVSLSDLQEPFRGPAVCDSVLPDHRATSYRCVEYLARRGHRKIALLDWELNKSNGREILAGYRQALEAFGLDYNPDWIVDLPTSSADEEGEGLAPPLQEEKARQAYQAWKQNGDLPTALIHGSGYECTINDLVMHCMDGHFAPDAILGRPLKEQLMENFRGLGSATAICMSIEPMARMSLELLQRHRKKNQPPVRYTVEDLHLYKRTNGVWREEPMECE